MAGAMDFPIHLSLISTGALNDTASASGAETTIIILFDVMNVVALLLSAGVLLPSILSPTVSRSSTWMAMMASFIFYCSSYLFLLPIGQRSVPEPAHGPCLFQAALVYGAPVLSSFTGLAYVLQLYFGILSTLSGNKYTRFRINSLLLIIPACLLLVVMIESLIVGYYFPSTVTIDSTRRYCHITNRIPRTTTAALIGIATVAMMFFETLISIHLYRNWSALRRLIGGNIAALTWSKFGRVVIFTVFPAGAFVLNIAGLFSSGTTNDKWNMFLPIFPLGGALIFGSQMDIIKAWKFWNAPNNGYDSWNAHTEQRCRCKPA